MASNTTNTFAPDETVADALMEVVVPEAAGAGDGASSTDICALALVHHKPAATAARPMANGRTTSRNTDDRELFLDEFIIANVLWFS